MRTDDNCIAVDARNTIQEQRDPVKPVLAPQYFNTDRSKAVLLLWFLTVTCFCSPYLYSGSPIM